MRLAICLTMFPSFVESANILACVPTPSYSHQVAFYELWKTLSLRGHQVTLITTDPLLDDKLKNLTEIDVSHTYTYLKNVSKLCENDLNPWNYMTIERRALKSIRHYQLSHPEVKDLTRGKGRFDVVLVEYVAPELLLFGKIYKCPTILLSSTDLDQTFHQVIGNPAHPILHPDIHLPYHRPLSFSQRLLSTAYYIYKWYDYNFKGVPFYEENMRKYFNVSIQMKELLDEVSMIFLNSHPVIHGRRPYSPGTISVNYRRNFPVYELLDMSVNKLVDSAKEGFIYFSLGSNLKASQLNKDLLEAIIETLGKLPYKILFKYEGDYLPEKPDNVKIVKWVPQLRILNHPNIKLFVTQGGRQSTEEAIYASVSMVIIPFFYDQFQNALHNEISRYSTSGLASSLFEERRIYWSNK